MSKRKVIMQQKPASLDDICGDIMEEDKIIDSNTKRKKVTKKVSRCVKEDDGMKNRIILEKINTVEKIVQMFPKLRREKNSLISNVLSDQSEKTNTTQEYVLQRVEIGGKMYYRSDDLRVMDESMNLIGFCKKKENTYEYILRTI